MEECLLAVCVVTVEEVPTVELMAGVITVRWWFGVAGDLEDSSFVVMGLIFMSAVDAVVFSWTEVEEEGCGVVITGGAVIAIVVHLLSGESYVGDGAMAELRLQGKPENKTKALVISYC